MTTTPLNRTLAQADAMYESEIDAQWRHWRRYLEAQHTLLTAQDAAATPLSFEGTDDLAAQARQAQDDLDHLPAAQRVLFDTVVAQYRAMLTEQTEAQRRAAGGHGPPVDVDALDQEVLDILLQGATGASAADGRGLVPMSRNEQGEIVWYSVDSALLERIPGDETFAVGRVSTRDTTLRMLGMLALLVGGLLFVVVWFWILPARTGEMAAVRVTAPQINDQPAAVWAVTTLILTDGSANDITLPVQVSSGRASHGTPAETPSAFWSSTDIWPLAICVDGDQAGADLAAFTSVRLIGSGETPDRVYTLHATPPTTPDLLLTWCPDRNRTDPRYGVLQRTEALPALAPGDDADLDAATTITVESIQGIGPGADASLPDNQQHVVVTVSGATGLDWPRVSPTLLVADGQRIETPDIQTDGDRTVVRYSVTLMTMPTEVVWQITHPETGRVVRWRTTLAPPPDRATILAQNLVVAEIAADPVAAGEPLTLHLVLSNRGGQPLLLTPDDIVLMQGTSRLETPPADALREPILPDGRIAVTLTVPVDPAQPLTLILGAQRYQITLGTERG